MDWYKGYSPQERSAMGRAAAPAHARCPPCSICGDPEPAKMQTHAEDYSKPYRWEPPAAYPVWTGCHSRLHSRFKAPERWQSFLAFLRKGWYAREVGSAELKRYSTLGDSYEWRGLSHECPVRNGPHAWWWEALTLEDASRTSGLQSEFAESG